MTFMRANVSETPERFMISDSLDEIVFCRYSNVWLPVGLYERDGDRPDGTFEDEVAYVFDMFPKMDEFAIVYKFWGQLSAPGYMDQTDYVLGDSRGDVAQQLLDMYFDEDEEYMDEDEKDDKEWLEDIAAFKGEEDYFRRTLKTLGEFIEGKVDNKEKRDGK